MVTDDDGGNDEDDDNDEEDDEEEDDDEPWTLLVIDAVALSSIPLCSLLMMIESVGSGSMMRLYTGSS